MKFYEYLIKVLRRYKSIIYFFRIWFFVYFISKNKKLIRKFEYFEFLVFFKRYVMVDI